MLQVGNSLYVVAKIIGTETSRVLGESAKGNVKDDLDKLAGQLAGQVAKTVKQRAGELVAKPVTREDRLAAPEEKLGKSKRPTVYVHITERHVGQATIDPAAETEVALFCRELGFEVIDPDDGRKSKADVKLSGEGFSEFASRHGNLISVKARLELKAVDNQTVPRAGDRPPNGRGRGPDRATRRQDGPAGSRRPNRRTAAAEIGRCSVRHPARC